MGFCYIKLYFKMGVCTQHDNVHAKFPTPKSSCLMEARTADNSDNIKPSQSLKLHRGRLRFSHREKEK